MAQIVVVIKATSRIVYKYQFSWFRLHYWPPRFARLLTFLSAVAGSIIRRKPKCRSVGGNYNNRNAIIMFEHWKYAYIKHANINSLSVIWFLTSTLYFANQKVQSYQNGTQLSLNVEMHLLEAVEYHLRLINI